MAKVKAHLRDINEAHLRLPNRKSGWNMIISIYSMDVYASPIPLKGNVIQSLFIHLWGPRWTRRTVAGQVQNRTSLSQFPNSLIHIIGGGSGHSLMVHPFRLTCHYVGRAVLHSSLRPCSPPARPHCLIVIHSNLERRCCVIRQGATIPIENCWTVKGTQNPEWDFNSWIGGAQVDGVWPGRNYWQSSQWRWLFLLWQPCNRYSDTGSCW